MSDSERRINYPIEPNQRQEWQRPYLQLSLYTEPPEEYLRQMREKEEAEEEPPRVIIIDL